MFKSLNVFRGKDGECQRGFLESGFSPPFGTTGRAIARIRHHLRSALSLLPQLPRVFECVQVDC